MGGFEAVLDGFWMQVLKFGSALDLQAASGGNPFFCGHRRSANVDALDVDSKNHVFAYVLVQKDLISFDFVCLPLASIL